jgi:hypothetical protein
MGSDLKDDLPGIGPDLRKMEPMGTSSFMSDPVEVTIGEVIPLETALVSADLDGDAEDPSRAVTPLRKRLGNLFRRVPAADHAADAALAPAAGPDEGAPEADVSAETVLGESLTPEMKKPTEPSVLRLVRDRLWPLRRSAATGSPDPLSAPDPAGPASSGMPDEPAEGGDEAAEGDNALTPEPVLALEPTPVAARSSRLRALSAKRDRSARAKDARGYPPIQVLIGWIGESSRKDVLDHARGFAADHIESLDSAWITMAEFRGGTLFEIHEGGGGSAYLPDLIEELSRDPDQVLWVPSGTKLNRVVTFSIVEGRPFSMMLNEADSVRVRASGQEPVGRTGRMKRLRPRGTGVLVVGGTLFAISFGALSTSAFLSVGIDQQPIPSLSYNADTLPHGQIIGLSDALREDRWVSRILFENGAWRAEFETFEELVLPEGTQDAQRLIDEAVGRDAILQEERDRKVRELGVQ